MEVSGQLQASVALLLGERGPGTHWIGGWVGPRTSLDDVEKRKCLPLLGLELRPSVIQPIDSRCTDCAPPAVL
jgi:hypothetical protein